MTRAKGRREMANSPNQRVGEIQESLTEEVRETGSKDTGFFNAQDGVKGRDGGPYLDYEERFRAETLRAEREGRDKPTYGDNVPASVGTTLSVAPLVVDNSLISNPSMAGLPGFENAVTDETFTGNDNLVDPVSVLPVDHGDEAPEDEQADVSDGDTAADDDDEDNV